MSPCKGCARVTNVVCLFRHWNRTNECPCQNCLVKMVCQDECRDREIQITKIMNAYLIDENESNDRQEKTM